MFFPFLKTLCITNIHISVLLKSMSRDQTEKRKRRNSVELSFKDINAFPEIWNICGVILRMILLFTLNGLKPSKGPDALRKLQRRRRPASEQDLKFLSGVKSDRFVNLHAMVGLKENVNQENLISIFSRSVSAQSLPKLFHILRGNQTVKMEDSYLGMLHDDPYSEYNDYYGSQCG